MRRAFAEHEWNCIPDWSMLSYSVNSILGLSLNCWIPPRIHQENLNTKNITSKNQSETTEKITIKCIYALTAQHPSWLVASRTLKYGYQRSNITFWVSLSCSLVYHILEISNLQLEQITNIMQLGTSTTHFNMGDWPIIACFYILSCERNGVRPSGMKPINFRCEARSTPACPTAKIQM